VKFIILLRKVTCDYVTLFDVYESAISPDILDRKTKKVATSDFVREVGQVSAVRHR